MATRKCNSYARGGRVKANTIKAGVTKSRGRKYCGGGKVYKCGGKLK